MIHNQETPDLFSNLQKRTVRVEFDGGNGCNNPKIGYGNGYGSYKIDDQPVVRVELGIPMSNNAAEVLVLCEALKAVKDPASAHLIIAGDSQIALNQAVPPTRTSGGKQKKPRLKATGTQLFQDSCVLVRSLVARFHSAETQWRGRAVSVQMFGH